jgi:predicted TIM-barrel fold metal-dependent hydrolase
MHEGRDFKYYLDTLEQLPITEQQKKDFLGGNLARLLGLKLEQ